MTDIVKQYHFDILVLYGRSFLYDTYFSKAIKASKLVIMLAVNLLMISLMKSINDYDD